MLGILNSIFQYKKILMLKKILKLTLISIGIIFLLSFSWLETQATDCSSLDGNAKDLCKKLEKQGKKYSSLINFNKKTQSLINLKIGAINQRQNNNKQNLNEIEKNLKNLTLKIKQLKDTISKKEKSIANQKKILAGFMQSYYDYDQEGLLKIILLNKTFSESLSQTDYLEQSGVRVSNILQNLKTMQIQLLINQKELEASYNKNQKLKNKLTDEKQELQNSKNQKQWLLTKTQGEEQGYRRMLATIEKQKEELFDFSSASNISDVWASLSKYDKPSKKYRASTDWYFSQRDSRWANQKIGSSRSTMKDYGCAVTAIAMVFRKHGSSTNPQKMARAKIFRSGNLINWPVSASPGIQRISSVSHGNVDWSTINSALANHNPVIVHIQKINSRGGHYVVITGKNRKGYIVHDPYFGPNLYLSTSMDLIGKLGTNSKTKIDQMIIYK